MVFGRRGVNGPSALYGLAMGYKGNSLHLQEMYGLEVSTGTLSAVTDKLIHTVKERQALPLESIYLLKHEDDFTNQRHEMGYT